MELVAFEDLGIPGFDEGCLLIIKGDGDDDGFGLVLIGDNV